ncbi:MAG: glycosyltransferase family 39 protein [Chloroflexota bacterium]|nr:glycosyltransferase family 39 protein [Chloroflexota bacterium]
MTIILFYAVARDTIRAAAALAAMMLLATDLRSLNFSRTAWDNIYAALFAIGACWTTTRALKTPGRAAFAWWAGSGLFVTAGLYGYFPGR